MSIRGTAVSRVSTSGAQGEADIVAQFRARHLGLVRLAALLLGDSAAAEDVVQDVFTRVWEGRHRLAAAGFTAPYFYRAVVNGCRSVHRRRRESDPPPRGRRWPGYPIR
jgi:DNA-directed RNA polymerase specialized sigma24 family protein